MKHIFLLLLLTGCSVARFYQGPSVSQELRKNEQGLNLVMETVEEDFRQKSDFVTRFWQTGKDPFIKENLQLKLAELRDQKDVVMKKTGEILKANNDLLKEVQKKSKIKEGDPAFRELEKFAKSKDKSLHELMKEFAEYRQSSQELEKIAFFTKMVKR